MNSSTKISMIMPPRQPSPQAILEMRPISSFGTSRGIMESLKTIENSAATDASEKKNRAKTMLEPGAACQSSSSDTILMTAKNPIQGFREPV